MEDPQPYQLTVIETSKLLNIPEKTINRWIRQGKIPIRHKNGRTLFDRNEILTWAQERQLPIPGITQSPLLQFPPLALCSAMEKGGIHFNLHGFTQENLFENALKQISFPPAISREALLEELLKREQFASTALGRGVALPHPRPGKLKGLESPMISAFLLNEALSLPAPDSRPIHLLIFLFSPDISSHLLLLARIGRMLKEERILEAFQKAGNPEPVFSLIRDWETGLSLSSLNAFPE